MDSESIEKFFLSTFLKISIAGVLVILSADVFLYSEDTLSIVIDCSILLTCILSYLIRNKHQTAAVLILTAIILSAMLYQCLVVPVNTTTSLSILLVVGFIISVMLKGRFMLVTHGITAIAINIIFVLQFLNPDLRFSPKMNDIITVAITYSILYFLITYATAILKSQYDKINQHLRELNMELHEKANEIETQNEELTQTQDNLNELNRDLERKVAERTEKLIIKTEQLIQFSFTNAHHLRGPVARLLGLVAIRKLDPDPDNTFFFTKVEEQANEIDVVVKQINLDLWTSTEPELGFKRE